MSRRGRALGFFLLALLAATAAAAIADGYGASAARGYGPLRQVVVLDTALAPGQRIGSEEIGSTLVVRRIPERFVPSDALAEPEEALGLVPRTALPAGSYLLGTQLSTGRKAGPADHLGGDRHPVEIEVSGAAALLAAGPAPVGAKVDVVVTSEPYGAGPGRTYVAAAAVPLLALRPAAEDSVTDATVAATLGLTKAQALRLIAAESFARKLTLLPDD